MDGGQSQVDYPATKCGDGQPIASVPADSCRSRAGGHPQAEPWHGWREFLKEIGTIVLGIVIAIGLEQLFEQIHWRAEVAAARRAIAAEIASDNRVFAFRVAAAPCIDRRLTAIEDIAERAAKQQSELVATEVMPDTGDELRDNVWESYRASQTLTHFDSDELALLSNY